MAKETKIVQHQWSCVCGLPWFAPEHLRRLSLTGGMWRGHPSQIDPWAQWVREQLPHSRNGVVYAADDGYLRCFDPTRRDDLGECAKIEAKSHFNGDIPHKDIQTLRAITNGVTLRPLVVTFDGAVPTHLTHWPTACPCCGAPGPRPTSSAHVTVYVVEPHKTTPKRMRPEALRPYLLTYFQHPEQ